MVRTQDFHSCNRGSIPRSATKTQIKSKKYFNLNLLENFTKYSMSSLKTIRWQQRFENYQKALAVLQEGLAIKKPSKIEEQGIIKSYEFTFALAWKTLKDYLESKDLEASFPREVLKLAYFYNIISNGEVWLEMLEKRNLLTHIYDENTAKQVLSIILLNFNAHLIELENFLKSKLNEK